MFLSLLVCPSGYFLNSNNNGACEACPVNTRGSGTNAPSCTDCPSGTNTQQMTGQTLQSACGKILLVLVNMICDILCNFLFLELEDIIHIVHV